MRRGGAPRNSVRLPFLLFLIAAAASLVLLLRPRVVARDETRVLMDTFVTVRVRATGKPAADAALRAAFDEIDRVARVLDWFDSTSAAGRPVAVAGEESAAGVGGGGEGGAGAVNGPPEQPAGADDLVRVLAVALDVARLSDGAFDPTIRPLTALWAFGSEPHVPPEDSIRASAARVGFRRVRVDGARVVADRPGVLLDLGAVAKGYAVDRAIETLRAAPGVRAGLVAAAGDIRAFGEGPRRGAWRIGLAHPRAPGEIVASFPLAGGAVSTSGDYERFFVKDGVRYHHILDPRTGAPARRSVSATVFAPTGTEADALATACFALGPEEGRRLLAGLPGREAIWIAERDGRLVSETTPGLAGRYAIDFGTVESASAAGVDP